MKTAGQFRCELASQGIFLPVGAHGVAPSLRYIDHKLRQHTLHPFRSRFHRFDSHFVSSVPAFHLCKIPSIHTSLQDMCISLLCTCGNCLSLLLAGGQYQLYFA